MNSDKGWAIVTGASSVRPLGVSVELGEQPCLHVFQAFIHGSHYSLDDAVFNPRFGFCEVLECNGPVASVRCFHHLLRCNEVGT